MMDDYRMGEDNPLPLLYQSGYLTITGFGNGIYTLGFPNEEVRYGFLQELLPIYIGRQSSYEFFADHFNADLRRGDVDAFMERMRAFLGAVPYELSDESERHYQAIFYIMFTLMGQYIQTEVRSAKGRADAVVYTDGAVYVFEFKLNGTAEDALRQIDDRGYAIPYSAGGRETVKIGVELDKASRNVSRWLTARQ
jgi:hypothetical protein